MSVVLVQIKPKLQVLWTITGHGHCRSCEAPVYWCTTTSGGLMPVDMPATEGAATVSHFATCPESKRRRKT